MKKTFTLGIFATFISVACFSQQKYEIGVEGGITNSKYKINDAKANLEPIACISGIGGINFRVNTKKNFYLEAALLATEYADGLKLKQQSFSSYSNSDEAVILALRTGYSVKLSEKISLSPVAGVAPSFILLNQDGSRLVYEGGTAPATYYEYETRMLNKTFFLLLQGGLGIDVKPHKRIKATLSANYYGGITTIKIFDVRYRINAGAVETASMYGKGSFLNYNFGIRYLFGKKP